MRAIKLGFIFLVFLFLIMTAFSLLIPSHIRISRATNLPNKKEKILAMVQNDSSWHPAYQDSASAKNFKYLSKKIIEQTDSTYILQLQQNKQKPVVSGWQLHGTPVNDSLTLQWYMDFQLSWYPWEKFSTLFYENTYGAMMEKVLASIKKQLIE